ncbi:hypothetical protein CEXT_458501 [Caerostris extrusa]|uniref:Uncharacterized protein n=1 Tax=Caerostris extrusa TaxID=172846 RepID=A0AAV4WAC3_CAEEX|nr:hypothetical protein CEXT_458501 [Caerostris extrusa]
MRCRSVDIDVTSASPSFEKGLRAEAFSGDIPETGKSEDPPIQKPRLPHSPNGHQIEQFVNREFEKSRRRCLADDSARVNSPTPHRGQVLSGIKKCVRYDCVHLVRLPTMLGVCCGGGTSHSVSLDGLHAERGDERAPESTLVAPWIARGPPGGDPCSSSRKRAGTS